MLPQPDAFQEEPARAAPPRPLSAYGLTPRALGLGVALIPVMCFWNAYSDIVAQSTELAVMSLSIGVVFLLLVLLLVNLALKRWLPRYAFTQAELLLIYIMQTVSIGISSVGMVQFLNMSSANVQYFTTPQNGWEAFHPYLRHWALPDPAMLRAFYLGRSSFFTAEHIRGWLLPILIWSAFIVVLLFVMLCVNAILRRRWVDQERLTFPIVMLPLEMTRDGGSRTFFSNRILWAGFLVAFVLDTWAGLAYLYPSLPFIPLKPSDTRLDLSTYLNAPPWNALNPVQLSFYPTVIGLVYFLPIDVSFSCWFFYAVRKLEDVGATALGFRDPGSSLALSRVPYHGEQAFGAFVGLALFSLWSIRGYLKETVLLAFRKSKIENRKRDVDEPFPYRWALVGLAAGFVALVAFAMSLGVSAWLAIVFFVLYLLVIITYTRIRAEAGLPWAFGPDMTPHQFIATTAGTSRLGMPNMVGLTELQWMDLDYRPTMMPYQLEAMKMGESARLNQRKLFGAILLATVVGALSAWVAILSCYYRYGAGTAHVDAWRTEVGNSPWQILSGWVYSPTRMDIPRLQGVGAGLLLTALLMAGRARFNGWPFHAVGYALSGTFTMQWIWCATLVGWAIKAVILRYGGMTTYRTLLPFFIGLILGEYTSGALWALYGAIAGVQTYKVLPI